MSTSLLKFSLKTNLVKSVISEIVSNISRYYYVYGHAGAWPDEKSPDAVSESYEYEIEARNEMLLYKQIDSNDIVAVIRRINWISGYTFDMYNEYSSTNPAFSGATALENAEFYCLTDDYNVYKCLYNNNANPSSQRPIGTSTDPIMLDDGYMWKYLYTVPLSVRNKFLTATTMPVVTALSNQFYSKGSIVAYNIENTGSKYPITSYKIIGFKVIDGGSGYSVAPTIQLSNPDQAGGVSASILSVSISGGQITAVAMNAQGSGYSYPPIVTIVGSASREAVLEPIVERLSSTYTSLVVTGDGYLEENPYQVQSINIISGGSNYASVTFLFTDPDLPNGIRAVATGIITAGVVTGVTITKAGYGYSKPFYAQNQSDASSNIVLANYTSIAGQTASGLAFSVSTLKNEAQLTPLINSNGEIQGLQITKPGIGYTYALVSVVTTLDKVNTAGFAEASILLSFGIGDIESRQSTVELTAIDGAIPVIDLVYAGYAYTSIPIVTISGDGSGCTATAILNSTGSLAKILVSAPGINYTKATVTITGGGVTTGSTNQAIAHAIISPKGGHGKDAVAELYAKTLVLHGNLSKEKNQGFTSTNDYRQICIVKNPKIYGKNSNLRASLASSCIVAVGAISQNGIGLISKDDVLTYTDTTTTPNKVYTFRVIENNAAYSTTESALLLSYLDNFIPPNGATLIRYNSTPTAFSTTSIIYPDVNKYSGEVLTIDNRISFSPSTEQIVVALNSITF